MFWNLTQNPLNTWQYNDIIWVGWRQLRTDPIKTILFANAISIK